MSTYGQFCPVAMASEVLTERWTPLVVRELLCGSTRFNDLRRGVPLMSPSLLSKRLKTLERVGVVERDGADYHLTPAGEELRPVIEALGVWGQRWARGDVEAKHYDASLLMWDIHRNIVTDRLPDGRIVVHFHLAGSSDNKSHFWLVLEPGTADLCIITDPGPRRRRHGPGPRPDHGRLLAGAHRLRPRRAPGRPHHRPARPASSGPCPPGSAAASSPRSSSRRGRRRLNRQ